jgi:copper homeostasis protein
MPTSNLPSTNKSCLIEACISTVQDAIDAQACGADRLELSAALEVDGVTPSIGLLREVLSSVKIPVVALIRVRSGNFTYDSQEIRAMLWDAEKSLELGATAIAVGCLTTEQTLDLKAMNEFSRLLGGDRCVCHRAFDACLDLPMSAQQLIDLGYRRILTSGGASTAMAGAQMLRSLHEFTHRKIELLAAGGIHPDHLKEFLKQSDCDQVHGSFRQRGKENKPPQLDKQLLLEACQIVAS